MTIIELENILEEEDFILINDTVLALGYGTRTFEKIEENGDQVIISITYCKSEDKY